MPALPSWTRLLLRSGAFHWRSWRSGGCGYCTICFAVSANRKGTARGKYLCRVICFCNENSISCTCRRTESGTVGERSVQLIRFGSFSLTGGRQRFCHLFLLQNAEDYLKRLSEGKSDNLLHAVKYEEELFVEFFLSISTGIEFSQPKNSISRCVSIPFSQTVSVFVYGGCRNGRRMRSLRK